MAYAEALSPPYSGSVDSWCRLIDLPTAYAIPGKFSVDCSPYLRQPFGDLKDPTVRMLNLIAATQTGKSLIAELYCPYIVVNDPGPVLRLHANDEMAQNFTETRLIPLLKGCPPVKTLLGLSRFTATKKGINLPHMSIKVGSAKESLLHGMSIRYLLMDEAHLYEVGTIEKALARTTAFAGRRKIVVSSQPNVEGSELSKYFNAGKIYIWQWRCFKCGEFQNWEWNKLWEDKTSGSGYGITWDKKVDKDGNYLLEKTGDSARLVCKSCRHEHQDIESTRRRLVDEGRYFCTKEDGDPGVKSYSWPGFVNTSISWKEKVIQYLQAKAKDKYFGLNDDLVTFYNQVLGVEWKHNIRIDASRIITRQYDVDANWPDEVARFMTVDPQRSDGVKRYVVRAWGKTECRLLKHGYVTNWDEIEAVRQKYKVPISNVGVDSGWDTDNVYMESVKRGAIANIGATKIWVGWFCLKGDGMKHDYLHKDGKKRYYSQELRQMTNFPPGSKYKGLVARMHLWANLPIKKILEGLRDNKLPYKWVSNTTDADYLDQMYSEVYDGKVKRYVPKNPSNPKNHFWDIESMQCVMSIMSECYGPPDIVEDDKKAEETVAK